MSKIKEESEEMTTEEKAEVPPEPYEPAKEVATFARELLKHFGLFALIEGSLLMLGSYLLLLYLPVLFAGIVGSVLLLMEANKKAPPSEGMGWFGARLLLWFGSMLLFVWLSVRALPT